MVAAQAIGHSGVHRHELLAALSRGIDLCMGQPMGHMLQQTFIALRLAECAGLHDHARREVYYTSMLSWIGCHVDSYEQARWFGDDHRVKAAIRMIDFADDQAEAAFMARNVGAGLPWPERRRTLAAFRAEGRRETDAMFGNHTSASVALADALGIDPSLRRGVSQVFERWDGRGEPDGLRGPDIRFSARAANLGDVVTAIHRAGGIDAAVAVARARRGTELDPELVDLFCDEADSIFAALAALGPTGAMASLCPALDDALDEHGLDDALDAFADFVDLKSPTTLGHQSATAGIVSAAADAFGLGGRERATVSRAARLHDLGRLGVPSAVWDARRPLSPAEVQQVRLHPYLTEQMLDPSPALRPLARVAVQHHERLDGSGYPRQLSGAEITQEGRLLAAADLYRVKAEARPHRPATPASEMPALMHDEVREGRLDGDAVEAVLVAGGHRRRRRRAWPAGLTEREVQVLRLVARGFSNADIAAALQLSPKTVGNHVDHVYTKAGVRNRAMAAVFAMRHGLMSDDTVP